MERELKPISHLHLFPGYSHKHISASEELYPFLTFKKPMKLQQH
jgi:hypothetical protein